MTDIENLEGQWLLNEGKWEYSLETAVAELINIKNGILQCIDFSPEDATIILSSLCG